MNDLVKVIMAVTVACAIIIPVIGNTVRGNILSEVTAATVATVLGAIIAGLFLYNDDDKDD